jgi:hypothetical protein
MSTPGGATFGRGERRRMSTPGGASFGAASTGPA